MTGEFSMDHSTATAWQAFRADLHAMLLELGTDQITSFSVLETGEGHLSPFLQFFKGEGGVVLSEVSSNQVLTDRFRLTPGQIDELLRIGWAPPSPQADQPQIPNFHLVDDDLDVIVARAQETLQSVFGIPHPQFLSPAPREDEHRGVGVDVGDPDGGEEPLGPDQVDQRDDYDYDDDDDDEDAAVEFMEHLSAWAHELENEMETLEPGESLVVTGGIREDRTGAVLTISRYLDTGLLARITSAGGTELGMSIGSIKHLSDHGWLHVPAFGSTGPDRLVLSASTRTPNAAVACLSGLIITGSVASLDDLSIGTTSAGSDWRRLPPHAQVGVTSFEELRTSVTDALEELGAHPALLPGIRLESAAANFSITVEVDQQAARLHIVGPVVTGPDQALIEGGGATLPTSGFDWQYTDQQLELTGVVGGSPFLPAHLEIVLAAAEDVILLHSRPLAVELGGRSAIEDYLAENAT